jgi:phosphatidylinositol alpha-mannosyltransferase
VNVQRVALVSPYALSVYGGAQEQVLAMSRELCARGCDVLIVAPDARDEVIYETPAKVLRLGRCWSMPANGSRAPLTFSPVAARRANSAVDAFGPDVVHFHEPFAPLLGWSTLRTHHHPALGTFHRSGSGPALTLTGPLLRRLAHGLDDAVSVSVSASTTLRHACGLESVVLFNGIETNRFVATPRARAAEPVLFFVGRLEERKGVAVAIEAVLEHNVHGATPWQLVIAGEGSQRRRLEALAARDNKIVFVGRVNDETKRAWLRRADVLIAPSTRGESFGLVLLEGMASETLVVASDIDGYRDAASGHATLFRPASAVSLEEAIGKALASRSDARVAAARRHAERWSMASLMDAYDEHYDVAIRRFRTTR